MSMTVIGLSGKLGTGKDFIADQYFAPRGFKQWSLAWHFKIWLIGKGTATYEEVFQTKPPHVRHLLQQEGTELGRNIYGVDVWIDTMFAWMQLFHDKWSVEKFVIPDVRFQNEVLAIQRHGGKVFRIEAPNRDANSGASIEARMHVSETDLDGFNAFDGYIYNDNNPVTHVDCQIQQLLGE